MKKNVEEKYSKKIVEEKENYRSILIKLVLSLFCKFKHDYQQISKSKSGTFLIFYLSFAYV